MPREDREPDELFEIRTNFYTGNYQQTINEASKLKVRSTLSFYQRKTSLFLGSTKSPNRKGFIHVSCVYCTEEIRCCFG